QPRRRVHPVHRARHARRRGRRRRPAQVEPDGPGLPARLMATTAQPLPGAGVTDVGHAPPPTPERALIRNLRTIGMVWLREIIRFRRTPARIISGLAQPILFLFVLAAGTKPPAPPTTPPAVAYQPF